MKIIRNSIIASLILTASLQATEYQSQMKFFKTIPVGYDKRIPKEVQAINYGVIDSESKKGETVLYFKKNDDIKKKIIKKIRKSQLEINENNKKLKELEYSSISPEIKERNKLILITMINSEYDKVKESQANLEYLNKDTETEYVLKEDSLITKVTVKKGTILLYGSKIFEKIDKTIARFKIPITEQEYKNIRYLTIRKNNILIKDEDIDTEYDEKTKIFYLIIYQHNPSDYELEQEYTIKID